MDKLSCSGASPHSPGRLPPHYAQLQADLSWLAWLLTDAQQLMTEAGRLCSDEERATFEWGLGMAHSRARRQLPTPPPKREADTGESSSCERDLVWLWGSLCLYGDATQIPNWASSRVLNNRNCKNKGGVTGYQKSFLTCLTSTIASIVTFEYFDTVDQGEQCAFLIVDLRG